MAENLLWLLTVDWLTLGNKSFSVKAVLVLEKEEKNISLFQGCRVRREWSLPNSISDAKRQKKAEKHCERDEFGGVKII
jgi:hypothetical protein